MNKAELSHEYRPAVMWFWNHDITESGIEKQLNAMRDVGIYEFFIHSMFGLEVEYLSPHFFELIAHVVKTAKKLGMKFWIYDELNWPSGQAGGKIIEGGNPDDLAKAAVRREGERQGGVFTAPALGRLIYAESVDNGVYNDITAQVSVENGLFSVTAPETARVIFYAAEYLVTVLTPSMWTKYSRNLGGLADLLNPETAQKFLELTYGGYEKAVGEEMGKTVRGSFTDEDYPSSPFEIGEGRATYTPALEGLFEKRTGRAFGPSLHYLFENPQSGEGVALRHAYFSLLKEMYFESFLKPLATRCEKDNLILTGHLQGDGFLTWELTEIGDYWEGLSMFGAPGLDSVCSIEDIDRENGFHNVISARCRTVSKYFGRDRIICETYSGSGWSLSFEDMDRVACRLLINGCNMLQYMGGYYSIDGSRKVFPTCYPPSHNCNNPLFSYYKDFGDRMQYPCRLSAETKASADVLMFIPRSECERALDLNIMLLASEGFRWSDRCPIYYCEGVFENLCECFLRNGVGFDTVPESEANGMTVADGAVFCRGFRYTTVVFPVSGCVTSAVRKLIAALKSEGVSVLFVNRVPSVEAETGDCFDFGFDFSSSEAAGDFGISRDGSAVLLSGGASVPAVPPVSLLAPAVMATGLFKPTLGFSGSGKCLLIERENSDKRVWFLFNPENNAARVSFSELPDGLVAEDRLGVPVPFSGNLTLSPRQFIILSLGKNSPLPYIKPAARHFLPTRRLRPAAKLLTTSQNKWRPASFEFESGDIKHEVSFDTDLFPIIGANAVYSISFDFECDFTGALKLAGEYEGLESLTVNGIEIRPEPRDGWGCFNFANDISSVVRNGKNTVSAVCRLPEWTAVHTVPFLYLEGAFYADACGIRAFPAKAETVSTGGIFADGLPFFSGDLSLEFSFEADGSPVFLDFSSDCPVTVQINGTEAARLIKPPFRTDITAFCSAGENKATLTLTASLAMLFGGSGLRGITGLSLLYGRFTN